MDAESLLARAAERADELPGASMSHPFGEDWDVWKVRGKVFMLFSQIEGCSVAIVKSAPSDAQALVQGFADITPGYHMNKKHWITLHGTPVVGEGSEGLAEDEAEELQRLDAQLVDDLVAESYLLVVEKLPRKERPVDPATFGQQG